MDTLRIISIALLAGCSVAGLVWYIWGLGTSVKTYKKQRIIMNTPQPADESENTE